MALGLVQRFFLSLLFFWAGLHLVGLGIEFSGTAGAGNPVWPLIQALYAAEAAVLHALYRLLQGASLILLAVALVCGASALRGVIRARRETIGKPAAKPHEHVQFPSKACETAARPAPAEPAIHSNPLPASPRREQPEVLTPAPARIETPRSPTAQERKTKAIQQILGG